MGVAVGFNAIVFGGLQILRGSGNSIVAFYAAESGAENILFEDIRSLCNGDFACLQAAASGWEGGSGVVSFTNGAFYSVNVVDASPPDCNGVAYCAQSTGTFKGANRRIEIER
jgi:hypothetical protein